MSGDDFASTGGHPRKWLVLAMLAAVGFMAQLDLFVVNLAVPAMGEAFPEAGLGGLSWVLNAYAIVFGALLVPAGRLADRYGRRRLLLLGVLAFTIGSAMCAAAPTLTVLVVGRVVQAIGAAATLPTSLALLYPAFPRAQHATVVGIWAGVAAVAATAGPAVGGVLVAVDWRLIFLVNLPIGLAVLALGRMLLPEVRTGARLPSPTSVALLLAAVSLIVLVTVEASVRGASPVVVALAVLAGVALVATVLDTLRHPTAVVPRALFVDPRFQRASVALTLFFVAFAAWLLIGGLFLQNLWGYTPARAGLALAPGPLAAAVFALGSGRIVRRFGPTVPAVVGPLLVACAGLYWWACTPATADYLGGFLAGQIIGGIGSGLTQAPLFAASGRLPAEQSTTGSAFLNMCRQIGSALGVALLVAVMADPDPTELSSYRRGWLLVATAAAAAAAVQLRRRRRPSRTLPTTRPDTR